MCLAITLALTLTTPRPLPLPDDDMRTTMRPHPRTTITCPRHHARAQSLPDDDELATQLQFYLTQL